MPIKAERLCLNIFTNAIDYHESIIYIVIDYFYSIIIIKIIITIVIITIIIVIVHTNIVTAASQ